MKLFKGFLVFLMLAVVVTLVVGTAKRLGLPSWLALALVPVALLLGWLGYRKANRE
ncbi:hypothetical protein PVT67_06585 [Gallaecimonas kandeliae]|uniref:hypothetical protein n=1 Tax=Gallaecimonas kandeliae TaxID=3029055 RepID=UPI00264A2AEB|nr:hypothetical protein [Gallaecimonas kandeliae]WKE66896.1 hypothetical protein PVT67_06585 [Gallaecimonas kandeliae]